MLKNAHTPYDRVLYEQEIYRQDAKGRMETLWITRVLPRILRCARKGYKSILLSETLPWWRNLNDIEGDVLILIIKSEGFRMDSGFISWPRK